MKLTVVIPCYNERKNIPLIVKRISKTFEGYKDIEVILVDNGSNDGSEEVFKHVLEGQSLIRCIKVAKNKGYGYGILSGITASKDSKFIAWTHADMQTDPKDVLKAFDLLCQNDPNKNIVKGKRRNRPWLDTAFTFMMQVIASVTLGTRVVDVNAQPKVFSMDFFNDYVLENAPHDFSLDLFLLYQARKLNMNILTIPVEFTERIHGESKGGGNWKTRIKLIMRTIKYIIYIKRYYNKGQKR